MFTEKSNKRENTPIQMILSSSNNRIFVKRDDLYPLYFGGNKARKAELFEADILKQKSNYIVTYGSGSSNHCRTIAAVAAKNEIPCLIITPEKTDIPTGNQRIATVLGAKYRYCPVNQVAETIADTISELTEKEYRPYFIPGGGHGVLGTHAYVTAYREIVAYEQDTGIHFDYIFFASGTGTTHAGLVCGKHLYGRKQQKIVGISIARTNPRGRQVVLDSILEYLGEIPFAEEEVEFVDSYISGGYGKYCSDELDIIRTQLVQNALPLDITYTGKAFWGMAQYIESKHITGQNILFIHTGGTPLFFDDLEKLI